MNKGQVNRDFRRRVDVNRRRNKAAEKRTARRTARAAEKADLMREVSGILYR